MGLVLVRRSLPLWRRGDGLVVYKKFEGFPAPYLRVPMERGFLGDSTLDGTGRLVIAVISSPHLVFSGDRATPDFNIHRTRIPVIAREKVRCRRLACGP